MQLHYHLPDELCDGRICAFGWNFLLTSDQTSPPSDTDRTIFSGNHLKLKEKFIAHARNKFSTIRQHQCPDDFWSVKEKPRFSSTTEHVEEKLPNIVYGWHFGGDQVKMFGWKEKPSPRIGSSSSSSLPVEKVNPRIDHGPRRWLPTVERERDVASTRSSRSSPVAKMLPGLVELS